MRIINTLIVTCIWLTKAVAFVMVGKSSFLLITSFFNFSLWYSDDTVQGYQVKSTFSNSSTSCTGEVVSASYVGFDFFSFQNKCKPNGSEGSSLLFLSVGKNGNYLLLFGWTFVI